MARGYMGKLLNINLSTGDIIVEPLDYEMARQFIGGYGIGVRLLYERMKPDVDPLGPDNILGFFTGPMTGTPCIEGNRFQVVCKSPLTGTWGDSNCGGTFGPHLKFAGYDGILFHGVAKQPVYLWIENGKAVLRDATYLWGKDTNETEDILRAELGRKVEVACIGQAGENLSLISGIINDKGRAAGRSGVGAVMGSKKLKAIAVRGSQVIEMDDPERAGALRKEYLKRHGGDYDFFSTFGTTGIIGKSSWSGDSPVKNWGGVGQVDFPTGKEKFDAAVIVKHRIRKYGCWKCTIACGGHMEIKEPGPYFGTKHHKVEYETAAAFGTMTLMDNFPALVKINELCNRYGFDTISAGCTLAFAIECYENGLISRQDTDGVELRWGNDGAIIAMLERMALRQGFGDVLADGSARAADRIGGNAAQFAMHIQGQELPLHDPKFQPGLATTYKLDATPARHTQGGAYWFPPGYEVPEGFDKYVYTSHTSPRRWMVNMMHVVNAAGICQFGFTSYDYQFVPNFLTVITGWDFNEKQCLEAGERIGTLRHTFNLREGVNPLHREVPGRVLGNPPQTTGPLQDITVDLDTMIREYLIEMDWDLETACPSQARLQALGLAGLVNDLP